MRKFLIVNNLFKAKCNWQINAVPLPLHPENEKQPYGRMFFQKNFFLKANYGKSW